MIVDPTSFPGSWFLKVLAGEDWSDGGNAQIRVIKSLITNIEKAVQSKAMEKG